METSPLTGAELARRRNALGISQVALARAMGLTQATISRYETESREVEHPVLFERAMRDLEREYTRADEDYDRSRDDADAPLRESSTLAADDQPF